MRKILRDFRPVSAGERVSSSVHNAEFNLKFPGIKLPEGEYCRGFRLDIDATPVGSGTGTYYIAQLIDSIQIVNELGEVVFEAGADACLGIASLLSHLLNADEVRTAFKKTVCAATATSYNSWWEILQSMKGKEFDIIVNFTSPPSDFLPTTFTGLATSMGCTLYTSDEPGEQVNIAVEKRVDPDQITNKDGALAYFIAVDNAELSSKFSQVSFGGQRYTAEALKALENDTAHLLEGFHTAGSEGAVQYMAGVQGPVTANQLYAILRASEKMETMVAASKASVTAYVAKAIPASLAEVSL
jgi:hypothetical protein